MGEYKLTEDDKKELAFLKQLIPCIPRRKCEPPLEKILDAIENGEAERRGISARRSFKEGKIGALEREQGRKKDGTVFYFARTYSVNDLQYHLDTMFRLEPDSAYSYAK